MNKVEAIKAMLNGDKIAFKGQVNGQYWYFQPGDGCEAQFKMYDGKTYEKKNVNDMAEIGWRIYEEPIKLIKMWQWVIKTNTIQLTSGFFINETAARNYLANGIKIIQRADWTEIEVEE